METMPHATDLAKSKTPLDGDPSPEQRLVAAGHKFVELAEDVGLSADIAALFRQNPLAAEHAVRDLMFGVARAVLQPAFAALDDHGPSLTVDGKSYHRVAVTRGEAMTMFGPVEFERSRYRPSGKGAAIIPADSTLGLTTGGMTPATAGLSMYLMSGLTARESAEAWRQFGGQGPATASLIRLSAAVGSELEAGSNELLATVREREALPSGTASLLISLDGVMMRMQAETVGDIDLDAGWREAACGVVGFVDAAGNLLDARCFGQRPAAGKETLPAPLSAELFHWLTVDPNLKVVAVADGAPDNWTFLEALCPDLVLLDYWHAAQHLKAAADAAFGQATAAGTAWFAKWRHTLRHDANGVAKVIDALRYLLSKGTAGTQLRRELGYFRHNRHRMDYAAAAAAGYAIGSGAVEAANKVLVTTRMKRSGQSWGRDGGQGVLSIRALAKSGRFDRAWEDLVPRLNRQGNWVPKLPANDNRAIRLALVA